MAGLVHSALGEAVGDPSATRTVYITVVLLALLGVVFVALAVWVHRRTRPDPELLAPLEEMERRKWRELDPASQRRLLDEARPAGAMPLERSASVPNLDQEFATARPVQSLEDLTPDRVVAEWATDGDGDDVDVTGSTDGEEAEESGATDDSTDALDAPEDVDAIASDAAETRHGDADAADTDVADAAVADDDDRATDVDVDPVDGHPADGAPEDGEAVDVVGANEQDTSTVDQLRVAHDAIGDGADDAVGR